ELYEKGNYREAAKELEQAQKLDPDKNLVMNLSKLYEKLGEYDRAIAWLKTYLDMEGVAAAERQNAEVSIKRLEAVKQKAPPPTPTAPPSASTTAPPTRPPENGRVDSLTIAAAGVAVVGLAAGTGLGIYALTSRPSDFVTGRDGSYETLQAKTA